MDLGGNSLITLGCNVDRIGEEERVTTGVETLEGGREESGDNDNNGDNNPLFLNSLFISFPRI